MQRVAPPPLNSLDPAQPLDLAELARQAVAEVWPLAEAKGTELALEAPAVAMCSGDASALRILMRNVLDNAVRYTPEGGKVHVTMTQQGDAFLLAVDDSGPGIPADERDRAFQRFYLGQRKAGDGIGSGLGLAIVANIAARHGGAVALLDSALGGLRVELRFLKASAATTATL